jgi:hypothetical protein
LVFIIRTLIAVCPAAAALRGMCKYCGRVFALVFSIITCLLTAWVNIQGFLFECCSFFKFVTICSAVN